MEDIARQFLRAALRGDAQEVAALLKHPRLNIKTMVSNNKDYYHCLMLSFY